MRMKKRQRLSLKAWQHLDSPANLVESTKVQFQNTCNNVATPFEQCYSGDGDIRRASKSAEFEKQCRNFDENRSERCLNCIASLNNLGNTCYLNSIVVVMRYLKEFRTRLHQLALRFQEIASDTYFELPPDAHNEITLQLHELFKAMHNAERLYNHETANEAKVPTECGCQPLNPMRFLESIRDADSIYEGNQQHDAHEFLGLLLNCLEMTFLNYEMWCTRILTYKATRSRRDAQIIAKKQLQPVINIFEGKGLIKTQCLECENYSEVIEIFRDVAIPSNFSEHYGENLIKVFEMRDKLAAEDKFWCSVCYHHNEALRTFQVLELPEVLIIQMKPSYVSTIMLKEINKASNESCVKEELSCFVHSCNKPCLRASHRFRLTSVVCHVGSSLASGHYTVYVNNNVISLVSEENCYSQCCSPTHGVPPVVDEQWLHFSDDRVKMIRGAVGMFKENSNEIPYLLVYQRLSETKETVS